MPTTRSQTRTTSKRIVPDRVTRAKIRPVASRVQKADSVAARASQARGTSRATSLTQNAKSPLDASCGSRQHTPAGQTETWPASQPTVKNKSARKRDLGEKRNMHAISRLGEVANIEISRLEDVTDRAQRRLESRECFAALSQNRQGSNHARHADYTPSHLINGDTIYKYKTSSPFAGRLVSPGTVITIDGEDYVEYRMLAKPHF